MAHATRNTTTGLKFQYMLDYINSVTVVDIYFRRT